MDEPYVNYRTFRVTFVYSENAACIHEADQGIATIKEAFATQILPEADICVDVDSIEVTEYMH